MTFDQGKDHMGLARDRLQIEDTVVVEAPLQVVWEYLMDITKIPEFHPRVTKVDLLSGTGRRAEGVSYKCSITEGRGKGMCVEKIVEIVPLQSFVTTIPEDSWGISKLFANYLVDTVVTAIDTHKTRVTIRQHYATRSMKAKFANLLARRKIASQTADTLRAIKRGIERDWKMSKS
jgi:hypothetical protein